jgi:hypothetical protein
MKRKIIQCDICGAVAPVKTPGWVSMSKRESSVTFGDFGEPEPYPISSRIDICPDCVEEIKKQVKEARKNK